MDRKEIIKLFWKTKRFINEEHLKKEEMRISSIEDFYKICGTFKKISFVPIYSKITWSWMKSRFWWFPFINEKYDWPKNKKQDNHMNFYFQINSEELPKEVKDFYSSWDWLLQVFFYQENDEEEFSIRVIPSSEYISNEIALEKRNCKNIPVEHIIWWKKHSSYPSIEEFEELWYLFTQKIKDYISNKYYLYSDSLYWYPNWLQFPEYPKNTNFIFYLNPDIHWQYNKWWFYIFECTSEKNKFITVTQYT